MFAGPNESTIHRWKFFPNNSSHKGFLGQNFNAFDATSSTFCDQFDINTKPNSSQNSKIFSPLPDTQYIKSKFEYNEDYRTEIIYEDVVEHGNDLLNQKYDTGIEKPITTEQTEYLSNSRRSDIPKFLRLSEKVPTAATTENTLIAADGAINLTVKNYLSSPLEHRTFDQATYFTSNTLSSIPAVRRPPEKGPTGATTINTVIAAGRSINSTVKNYSSTFDQVTYLTSNGPSTIPTTQRLSDKVPTVTATDTTPEGTICSAVKNSSGRPLEHLQMNISYVAEDIGGKMRKIALTYDNNEAKTKAMELILHQNQLFSNKINPNKTPYPEKMQVSNSPKNIVREQISTKSGQIVETVSRIFGISNHINTSSSYQFISNSSKILKDSKINEGNVIIKGNLLSRIETTPVHTSFLATSTKAHSIVLTENRISSQDTTTASSLSSTVSSIISRNISILPTVTQTIAKAKITNEALSTISTKSSTKAIPKTVLLTFRNMTLNSGRSSTKTTSKTLTTKFLGRNATLMAVRNTSTSEVIPSTGDVGRKRLFVQINDTNDFNNKPNLPISFKGKYSF